ncbi:SDR family NAD(P)-dependent oxidoreductase [Raineya orbicola]|jgi:short-subunit dehydrogenase|uniref:Short-chain dehydrogenase n=1 Tax=Raineya orbicola TaxID=2016530 RepID=A0A2N3I905_9BACT|nr:SDR family NAD(P)-dependent oxidoreductase [Raineya orbicola]PKQ66723.1 Short-chain dehydrogenase [Raineya orbicola]
MNISVEFALITGGSRGLGKAIAENFAQRKIPIILVALPEKVLIETAQYLQNTYQVDVKTFGIDLTEQDAPQKVFDFVQENKLKVKYLVNNAGIGYTDKFERLSTNFLDKLLKINTIAVTQLTRLFIPALAESSPAYILNVASMAGLFTMPYKAAYSASKHYVIELSFALREELKEKNISVTVVCPGGIMTNPEVLERVEQMGNLGKILTASPDFIAKVAVKAMMNKRKFIVPKWQVKFYSYLRWVFPKTWQAKIIAGALRKKIES